MTLEKEAAEQILKLFDTVAILIQAVENDDLEQVKKIANEYKFNGVSIIDWNIRNLKGLTLLQIAAERKCDAMIKFLLCSGVTFNADFMFEEGLRASDFCTTWKHLDKFIAKLKPATKKQEDRRRRPKNGSDEASLIQFENPKFTPAKLDSGVFIETPVKKKNGKSLQHGQHSEHVKSKDISSSNGHLHSYPVLSFHSDYQTVVLKTLITLVREGRVITDEIIMECLFHESLEYKEAQSKKEKAASDRIHEMQNARALFDKLFSGTIEQSKTILAAVLEMESKNAIALKSIGDIAKLTSSFQESLCGFSDVLPNFERKVAKLQRLLKETNKRIELESQIPNHLQIKLEGLSETQAKLSLESDIELYNNRDKHERYTAATVADFFNKKGLYRNFIEDLPSLKDELEAEISKLLQEMKDFALQEREKRIEIEKEKSREKSQQGSRSSSRATDSEQNAMVVKLKKEDTWHGGKTARRQHFEAEQKQAKEQKEAREQREARERMLMLDRKQDEQGGNSEKPLHFSFRQDAGKVPIAITLDSKGQISGKVFFAENLKILESILKSAVFKPNSEKNHARFKAERHALLGAFGQMIEILKVLYNKNTPMIAAFNHIRNVIFHSSNVFSPIQKTSSLKDVQKDNARIIEMTINTLAFLNDLKNGLISVPKDKDALLLKIKSKLLYAMDADEIPEIGVDACLKQIELGAKDLGDYCELESDEISDMLDMARGFSVTQIGTYTAEIKKLDFKYYSESLKSKIKLDRDAEWFIEQGKDFRHIRKMDLGGKSAAAKSESRKSETAKKGKQKSKGVIKKVFA